MEGYWVLPRYQAHQRPEPPASGLVVLQLDRQSASWHQLEEVEAVAPLNMC